LRSSCPAEIGYPATGVAEIGVRTDVPAGDLYYHIKSEQGLLCSAPGEFRRAGRIVDDIAPSSADDPRRFRRSTDD
jgi:AcrR family transcriptional regulator